MSLLNTIQQVLDFPAHCLAFSNEDVLFVGGRAKNSTKNRLVSFEIEKEKLIQLDSLELSAKEDCPMSIACHPQLSLLAAGINGPEENLQENNLNCRIFDTANKKIIEKQQVSTSRSKGAAVYQKVARFSRSGNYLAIVLSNGKVSVFKTDDWTDVFPSYHFKDVQDVDFDLEEEHVAVVSSSEITIISLQDKGRIVQQIESPTLNGQSSCSIQAARYAVFSGNETLYAIVNSTSKGHAYICAWKIAPQRKYPLRQPKTAGICRKNVICLSVSRLGDLIAFTSIDLSISLLNAQTFERLSTINQIHELAISDITFNHSGKYLATAGADGRCKVIELTIKKNPGNRYIKSII